MKRFSVVVLVLIVAMLTAAVAYAGPLDAIRGWVGGAGWTALALGLSAVLAIGGIATKARWFSVLCIAVGTTVTGWGVALQDGKLTVDELKEARANIRAVWAILKPPRDGEGETNGV